jgi:hypothetical protein
MYAPAAFAIAALLMAFTAGSGDEDKPRVLGVTIDRPPDETREQWLARTARERGLPAPAADLVPTKRNR